MAVQVFNTMMYLQGRSWQLWVMFSQRMRWSLLLWLWYPQIFCEALFLHFFNLWKEGWPSPTLRETFKNSQKSQLWVMFSQEMRCFTLLWSWYWQKVFATFFIFRKFWGCLMNIWPAMQNYSKILKSHK